MKDRTLSFEQWKIRWAIIMLIGLVTALVSFIIMSRNERRRSTEYLQVPPAFSNVINKLTPPGHNALVAEKKVQWPAEEAFEQETAGRALLERLSECRALRKEALANEALQKHGKAYGLTRFNEFISRVPLRGLATALRDDQVRATTVLSPFGLRIVMETTDGRHQMIFDSGRVQKVSALRETIEIGAHKPEYTKDWGDAPDGWSEAEATNAVYAALARLNITPRELGVTGYELEHPKLVIDGKRISPFWIVRLRDGKGRMPVSAQFRMSSDGKGELVNWFSPAPVGVDQQAADFESLKKQFFASK